MPVPDNEAVCGLLDAPSVTVRVPVSAPMMLGVNVIEMVQFPLAGTLLPHVLVWAKSPLVVMLEIPRQSRLLVKVMVFAALVVPSACLPKLSEIGLSATGTTPVPANEAVCGLLDAASVTVKVPVSAPMMLGVNVTEMVHLLLAGTLLPHVLVWAKSPLVVMLEMPRAESRLLLKVTVFAALVVSLGLLAEAQRDRTERRRHDARSRQRSGLRAVGRASVNVSGFPSPRR